MRLFSLGGGGGIPVGGVIAYSGNDTPENFLICDGAALSRTTYAALFAAIGTTYGAGDGSTTFNIPNTINRVLEGGTAGAYVDAGLPNIIGQFTGRASVLNGAFYAWASDVKVNGGSGLEFSKLGFSAELSNDIYGASDTVQMAAVITKFLIRYA